MIALTRAGQEQEFDNLIISKPKVACAIADMFAPSK